MLDINPAFVRALIDKAQGFHVKEEVVFPHEPGGGDEDWVMQVLADHADDPTLAEITAAIDELEPDQQMALVALRWIGRGEYSADDWESALAEAENRWTPRTAAYLIGTPLVSDYWKEGLVQLGYPLDED